MIVNKIFTVIAEAFDEMDKREATRAGYDAASELTETLVHLRERVATLETVQARHDDINDMGGDRLAALETAMNDQRAIRDSIRSMLKSLSSRVDSLSQQLDSHDKRMDSLSQRLDLYGTRGASQPPADTIEIWPSRDERFRAIEDAGVKPAAAALEAVRVIIEAMKLLNAGGVEASAIRHWLSSGRWKRQRQRAPFREARRLLVAHDTTDRVTNEHGEKEEALSFALRVVEAHWSGTWAIVQGDAPSQVN
ncbi:MAG: hypothetical protein IPK80_00525 [Nannocystis sp.]|nr:hypothetical protein [Nannocystis sp.]